MKTPANKAIPSEYQSGKAASSGLGVPESVIKWCRDEGCPAFDSHHRVGSIALISFIGEKLKLAIRAGFFKKDSDEMLDPVQEKAGLDRERKLALIRTRKVEEKELMRLDDIEELLWQNHLAPLRDELLQAGKFCFPNEPDRASIVNTRMAAILKKINDSTNQTTKQPKE